MLGYEGEIRAWKHLSGMSHTSRQKLDQKIKMNVAGHTALL